MHIPREALELWRFAATDMDRSHLCVWRLEPHGGEVAAVTTNGHVLGCYTWVSEEKLQGPIHFPAADVGWIIKNKIEDAKLLGDTLALGGRLVHAVDAPKFPEWRQVLPDADALDPEPFGIDVAYMERVTDYLRAIGMSTIVLARPTDPMGPVEFTTEYVEGLRILIMPARVGW
jgi:hypothetical protein